MDKRSTNLLISRAKIFLLAGLVGGMTACKDGIEPETPSTQQAAQTTKNVSDDSQGSQDSFMKHLSNVGASSFYSDKSVEFVPFMNGNNVAGIYLKEHGGNSAHGWRYGSDNVQVLDRNNIASTDGIVSFDVDNYNFIALDYNTFRMWNIENVPADDYLSKFSGMSTEVLAQTAKDSLIAAHADIEYANGIYDAITTGVCQWQEDYSKITLVSKGAKAGFLKHSDFGFKQGPTKIAGTTDKFETAPYIGGVESKRVKNPNAPVFFEGIAYVSVMPISDIQNPWIRGGLVGTGLHVFETDSMMASYGYGIDADTLRMHFNKWYHVAIIRRHADNKIKFVFGGYPAFTDFEERIWGVKSNDVSYVDAKETKVPNGLVHYSYVSETPEYSLYLSESEPLFYSGKTDTGTGLENVYCNAPRKNRTANDSTLPDEVVVSATYKEYTPDMVSIKGVEISIIFGGRRDKTR